MGNESEGLTPALRAACTRLVRIPMPGGTESLNLAVATGVMLYEMARAGLTVAAGDRRITKAFDFRDRNHRSAYFWAEGPAGGAGEEQNARPKCAAASHSPRGT